MRYAIIGSGAIGTALATQFSRKDINVAIANTRGPESLGNLVERLGPSIEPTTIREASKAELAILAVPFGAVSNVAKAFGKSRPRIVVDATNAIDFPSFTPTELGNCDSSSVVADAFDGSIIKKAFNTLPAQVLEDSPEEIGLRRVLFLSGDSERASNEVSELVDQLGFSPVYLGKLTQGGRLQQFGGPLMLEIFLRQD
ncbi:MAG: NAD(P)-binding domain-containing protein [Rudaea sp.]|uniref:NADPH-dependent F420 reductase n=1 Tax=unclassified Rudaea TaxID=2627037 RepID=UPI0010F725B4|nr:MULTISPECIES: NAD(P)-binding domain-containing protein [unclassified Rudaea]MBN8885165.1 NAD(P)-binding domain-containing protein [Rudaea sp.]MBQ3302556.1 NAD(P)-binding domain-containing protein [Eggerthellaceae bacterium]